MLRGMTEPRDLAATVRQAEEIARAAGRVLLEGWGTRPATRTKSVALDLVTEFDGRSEALIASRLQAAFPDDGVVGEEGARVGGSTDWVWYVDPLDGTTNFTHGLPLFAVSLGLSRGGARDPIVGVVHAPALGWTFSGWVGGGAWRDGVAIAPSNADSVEQALLATGFPYARSAPHSNLAEWASLTGFAQGTRRLGSAALDLAFVACGWLDGFWERHIGAWDLVGGAALVRAAGGVVTDLDGGAFDGQTGRALATNGRIHAALSGRLQDVARASGESWP